jgi:predicted DNA-binding transcriptional regulator YafY
VRVKNPRIRVAIYRSLLAHLDTLHFVGVPARTASGAPLRIRYAGREETTLRHVRIESVVMDRSETLLNVFDLDKQASRQLRLDRIERAEVQPPEVR